jgi:hypothetical protein
VVVLIQIYQDVERDMATSPNAPTNADQSLRDSYNEICSSYHSIDEFRTKLLGFLPLASGVGIFAITKDEEHYVGFVGIFGIFITIGLALFEIYGIAKCANLIQLGSRIDNRLGVFGQFNTRPNPVAGFINEVSASGLIYSSVLAAWTFLAAGGLFSLDPKQLNVEMGSWAALVSFALGVYFTAWYWQRLRKYAPCRWDVSNKDPNLKQCFCTSGTEICGRDGRKPERQHFAGAPSG